MKKVLILEDEVNIRSFVVINLKRAGYQVVEAGTGEEALEKLQKYPDIGVAILDIMLPDIDGFEVCRRIRATSKQIGVIMLTARTQEMDKVTGLMTGADDYVTKPFSPKELMLRVEAVLKRVGRSAEQGQRPQNQIVELDGGGLRADLTARIVYIDGQRVEMSPKEYDLFFYMLENRNIALSREKLISEVWGYDFYGDARTLDTHIKLLRKSLGKYSSYIVTLRGMGYRFEEVK